MGVPCKVPDHIQAVAINHDGTHAVVAYNRKAAQVWDLRSGQVVGAEMSEQSFIHCVSFHPNQQQVLTGSDGGMVKFWNAATGELAGEWKGHNGAVFTMTFSPEGKQLVSGSADGTIRFWNSETYSEEGKAIRTSVPITLLCCSPRKNDLFGVSNEGQILRWNRLQRDQPASEIAPGRSGSARVRIAVGAEGGLLVGGGQFDSFQFWSTTSNQSAGGGLRIGLPAHMVTCSSDGKLLAACYTDHTVRLWKAPYWQQRGPRVLTQKGSGMEDVQFSQTGQYCVQQVVSGSNTIHVKRIDSTTPSDVHDRLLPVAAEVTAMKLADHSARLLIGDVEGNVALWALTSGKQISGPFSMEVPVKALAWTANEELIAAGSQDGTIRVWDLSTGKERRMSKRVDSVVTALVFTRDGKSLIAGCQQGVYWFDLKTGDLQQSRLDLRDTSALAVAHNGKLLLQGSHSNSAHILDLATGKRQGAVLSHRRRVKRVTFSPDSLTAVTGGEDDSLKLWDVLTGQPRGEPLRHFSSIVGLSFPSPGWLQSASVTHAACRWQIPAVVDLNSQALQAWLESLTTMRLTEEGLIQRLSYGQWQERSQELHKLGGPPELFSASFSEPQ